MILNSLKILPINLHLADISKYRGWNSFSHAILNDDSNYSWNLHEINRIVDTGQILLSKNIEIHAHDTAKSLYQKTIASASESFSEVMDILLGNKSLVTSSLANLKNSPFHGKDSLKIYSLIESEKYNVQSLSRISRALYFPPYPSPLLRKDGASQPLLPLPVPDCDCESCNELRVYFSRF
jgi:methionyl-tRNA formyltransferase